MDDARHAQIVEDFRDELIRLIKTGGWQELTAISTFLEEIGIALRPLEPGESILNETTEEWTN